MSRSASIETRLPLLADARKAGADLLKVPPDVGFLETRLRDKRVEYFTEPARGRLRLAAPPPQNLVSFTDMNVVISDGYVSF